MISHRFSAIVLLERYVELDLAALQAAASASTPKFAANMMPGGGAGIALMFRVGATIITVMWRNERVPDSNLQFAIRHSPGWAGAADAIAKHTAHALIIMAIPATSHEAAVRDASFITFAASAVARAAPALAVFWPSADTLTAPAVFEQRAAALQTGTLPILTWCNVFPLTLRGPDGSTITTVMTRGLRPFIDAEVVHGPPGQRSAGQLITPTMDAVTTLIAEGTAGAQRLRLAKLPPLESGEAPCYVVESP